MMVVVAVAGQVESVVGGFEKTERTVEECRYRYRSWVSFVKGNHLRVMVV